MFKRNKNKNKEKEELTFEQRMTQQRIIRGFSDEDCWELTNWLTTIFPQMILNLRDMKNSCPEMKFEEFDKLPEDWKQIELNKFKKLQEKQGYEYIEDDIFTKWYILLTRMSYCLTEANEDKYIHNPYTKEYNSAVWGEDISKIKSIKNFFKKHSVKTDKGYLLQMNKVDKELYEKYWEVEDKNEQYKIDMKNEAMDLIKKYFYNLWD